MAEQARRGEFLTSQEPFRTNAFLIINEMVDWCNRVQGSRHLVDEILHSIFFLGEINNIRYTPDAILGDLTSSVKATYPRPFELYLSQLPRRSPFSCVTDMVVLLEKQDKEDQIKQSLINFIKTLKRRFLVSHTLCVSQSPNSSVRYYGVSGSSPNRGKIVTAASCLSAWQEYIAGAVMTYCVSDVKKNYFDGTFKLPQGVRCQAFNLSTGEEKDPCRSCGNLFGLPTSEDKQWPYGNCAEVESLSKLLKNEEDIKNQIQPTSQLFTPERRQQAQHSVLEELNELLLSVGFDGWDNHYYIPQTE